MPWNVAGLPPSDPARIGTPALIARLTCCSDPSNARVMAVAISPSRSIGASGEPGSSSACMIAGIARRRTSASSPRMAPRFQLQSSTTSVGVKVTFFAAIIVMVSSLKPRAVCSRPLAPASMARRASASVPTCTVVRIRRRLRFGHGREEHRVLQFRQLASGKPGFEHELDEIDAAAVEIGDCRPRFLRRLDLPRQHLRKAGHEAKHRRGMSAASGDRRAGVERPRRVLARGPDLARQLVHRVHVVGERYHRRHARRERGVVVVRQAIIGLLDRRAADAAGSAPVHVRIEQAGNEEAAAHVLDRRARGHRHAVVVQRQFRDAVIANHDAGVGDAAAEPVEHGRPAKYEHLSVCRTCVDAARAGHFGDAECRRRKRGDAERQRRTPRRSSRAIAAESDRCPPIETASWSG